MLLVQFLGSLELCMPGNADGIMEKQLLVSLEETGSGILEYAGKQYQKKLNKNWISWKKVSDLPEGHWQLYR